MSSSQDLTGKKGQCSTDTEAFLIAHGYTHIKRPLLKGLNEEIGKLDNGGNADLFIRLRDWLPHWIDSTTRRLFPRRDDN